MASRFSFDNFLPGAFRGAFWMIVSCACFAVLTAIIRYTTADVHPFQVAFLRNLFGLMFMLPWVWHVGRIGLQTQRFRLHATRSILTLGTMLCWFTAVSLLPLAEVTALSFTAPLFATVGAAFFLGERLRARRWTATLVGFAGAMILLRPGVEAFTPAAGLALAASAIMAVSMLVIKSLSRTEPPAVVVLYTGVLVTPIALIPALFVWTNPQLHLWPWLVAMGPFATIGHLALVRAFASAEATAVLPFDFSRLIFAALLGFFFFAERPDAWTWVGGAVIFVATAYTARRESQLRRADVRDG
jgi:drug/metabolite transporter (DMT)-like permease